MLNKLKKIFYFPVAYYFRFFAKIKLSSWKPYIIVVTGSSGKTSLLHLLESQIGDKAKYSHFANSSYGIPFDILDLKRENLLLTEWIYLFLSAPLSIFKKNPKEHIYIVEADCDRPGEGKFLATLLKPEISILISVGKTHTINFDYLVKNGAFEKVEGAIAYEFGYFLEYTRKIAIINGDSNLIKSQTKRAKAEIVEVSIKNLRDYKIFQNYTQFTIGDRIYKINSFLSKWNFYSLEMAFSLLKLLNIKPDYSFSKFDLPPGRGSIFKGVKNTTIIDSTYNATPDAVKAVLDAFTLYPAKNKWVILGDMIELGDEERQEHEKLAGLISQGNFEKIVLVGPRLSKYTFPKIKSSNVKSFLKPAEALDYVEKSLDGGEVLLFKGARFLEGIIEHLLGNKKDIEKLPRREKVWQKRRKSWGL